MRLPTIHLYDLRAPVHVSAHDRPRWLPGDQYPRALVRALRKPSPRPARDGLAMVTHNLSLGLKKIRQPHALHTRPVPPPADTPVGILHGPIDEVRSVAAHQRCVTGVGVLGAPEQWPTMFAETQAVLHLQASEWAAAHFRRRWGDRVQVWPVGIDTRVWRPNPRVDTTTDFLLYDKVRWERDRYERELLDPIREQLRVSALSFETIRYGRYRPAEYAAALHRCRALLFICEHETQGLACEEALASDVPVLAWDPGEWRDPRRTEWGTPPTPATSVPYFDARCGDRFRDPAAFPEALVRFLESLHAGRYAPRDYILENLTLEKCARHYVELLAGALTAPHGSRG